MSGDNRDAEANRSADKHHDGEDDPADARTLLAVTVAVTITPDQTWHYLLREKAAATGEWIAAAAHYGTLS
jgi:hypothetical protein